MSKSSMNDEALFNAANIIRSYGFSDQSSMIDILYRVVMTKKALSSKTDVGGSNDLPPVLQFLSANKCVEVYFCLFISR